MSDYVTSGDIGYIVPPEEPVIPEIHKHTYELHTLDDSVNMSLVVMRVCNCGDTKSGYFTVTFTDEDGIVTESKIAGNKIDYSAFYGQVLISITDEEGTDLKTTLVTANEKVAEPTVPEQPEQPIEPNKPVEPEQPNEPSMPIEPEQPSQPDEPITNTTESNNSSNSTAVALFIIIIVLALGGVGGFILYKKLKNRKQK